MNNKLENLRAQIDEIDKSIIILLAERMKIVKKVGEFKKQRNIPPLDDNRWQQVLNSKMEKARSLGLDPKMVKKIYNIIHDHALEIEKIV